MTIAARFERYLTEHNIQFQTVQHMHSRSSLHSGIVAGIPLMSLAKAVVLEDHSGHHVMAVLPSNNKIDLVSVNDELSANFHLVKERQVYELFKDCDNGAIPPIGSPYNMTTLCDASLFNHDAVYLESGDHETLLKLDSEAFKQLMSNSKCFRFSCLIFD